jgi:predicted RNA binding protein YcfA (HicA-like mRNA interferase family)
LSSLEKLINRFSSEPADFHFNELIKLLSSYGYVQVKTGKSSGSRCKFVNKNVDSIRIHKPHPTGILKQYQIKQIKEKLEIS